MIELDTRIKHAPGVVAQITGDEAVLLLPAKGEVKVLNDVGARIWALADGTRTLRTIIERIYEEYDVAADDAEADTLAFVGELAQRGMIELDASST